MSSRFRGLRRSLTDFRRHPWLHLVSISTITIALLILGGFFICYRNFENIAEKTSPNITGTVYLKEALTQPEIEVLRERILSQENVTKVTFKTKKSVAEELQVFLGGSPSDILPGSELFPDVIELEMKKETPPASLGILKSIVSKYPEVAEVDFSEDWLAQYKKVRQLLTWVGFGLMFALVVGCSFMIANFMGMRHQSRKEEIEIVNLIGAHRNFILTPFLWEGVIEGAAGSFIAILLLYIGKVFFGGIIASQWSSLLNMDTWLFLSFGQFILVTLIGIAMALFGGFTVFMRFSENQH